MNNNDRLPDDINDEIDALWDRIIRLGCELDASWDGAKGRPHHIIERDYRAANRAFNNHPHIAAWRARRIAEMES